jgi:hypothetical protein
LGKVALSFQAAPQGVPGIVWNEISPWLGRLASNAAPKWLPRLITRIPCGVPVMERGAMIGPCVNGAVAMCDVCGTSSCLEHCRIDSYGDAICYQCIIEAIRARQQAGPRQPNQYAPPNGHAHAPPQAGPSQEEITWALKTLKLKKNPTIDQIKTAQRKLWAENHPDTQRGERERVKAELKFKDVGKAGDILLKTVASAAAS